MGGRLTQGVDAGHPPKTLADPPCESPIRQEARGLHPLGALACTHVRQEEGDALSGRINQDIKVSMPTEPFARISNLPRGSGASPSGCARAHPHESDKDKSPSSHINLNAKPGMCSDRHGARCPGKAKP
jgi:hypothetical protein